tara:strand:- start:788 stop:1444 length:657 start_codon:yes stop_codon:yes gene_type:complete
MNIQNNLTIPIKTLKQAKELIGGYTVTSKMPTISYSISAFDCITGSKLRKIPNTVCSTCYALKGNYLRYDKNIRPAQNRRLKSISSPNWVNAMVYIMNHQKAVINSGLFRWHDSGDLQSMEHLQKIVDIATATPNIKHWLPTKESRFINNFKGVIPANLIIRLSGSFIDGKAPKYKNTSTVVSSKDQATCKSFKQNGQCLTCVQCWDSSIKNISYLNH